SLDSRNVMAYSPGPSTRSSRAQSSTQPTHRTVCFPAVGFDGAGRRTDLQWSKALRMSENRPDIASGTSARPGPCAGHAKRAEIRPENRSFGVLTPDKVSRARTFDREPGE